MKTIKRIYIKNQNGTCGDPAYHFVKNVLKRRYGNGVTFELDSENGKVLQSLKEAGFQADYDGFSWPIMEPADFEPGKTITQINDFAMRVNLVIKEVLTDPKHGVIAKVKYADRPRKRTFWIKAQTQESFVKQLKHELDPYGAGLKVETLL